MTAIDSREIRVFLSSTFRDMDAERDYLIQHVFPEVRRACAERGVAFIEIDLRWGVTEEASKNGQTVEICLAEIDRCRAYPPFFIGFMGQRYGWVPEPHELDAYWDAHADSPYAQPIRSALGQRIGLTELEMQFAVFDRADGEQASAAHFFLRDPALTAQLAHAAGAPAADFHEETADKRDKLERLCGRMRASGRVAIDGYRTIAEFGERVRATLLAGLDQRYPAALAPSPLQRRLDAHAQFAASRRLGYVPLPGVRDALAAALEAELQAPSGRPAWYLSGPSGIGKSAFMACLEDWLPTRMPGARVLAHYCGADGGYDIGTWRDDLILRLDGAELPAVLPGGDKARWDMLAAALQRAAARMDGPLVLLLDAIDQLDAPQRAIAPLEAQPWPAGVLLVVSGVPDCRPGGAFRVVDLCAPTPAQRAEMIGAFTASYRKALAPGLVERLAHAACAGSPLFLRMVLEELRTHARHETLSADIDRMLALPDADALFRHLLEGWDRDFADANHPEPMSRLAGLLALSRNGLDEDELADLLAAPNDPVSPATGKPRLPAARLSPMLALLRPYLLRHEGRERLMHAAQARGATPPAVAAVRILLLRHFAVGDAARCVGERLYQALRLFQADPQDQERRELLVRCLSDYGTVLRLGTDNLPLARDVLEALGAALPADDSAAARLGRLWAGQLHAAQSDPARKQGGWAGWLARLKPGPKPEAPAPKGLYHTCDWVERMQEWAFYAPALPLAQAAAEIAGTAGAHGAPVLARCWHALGNLHLFSGRIKEADACFARSFAASQAQPEQYAAALHEMAMCLQIHSRSDEALACIDKALAAHRALPAPDRLNVANSLGLRGMILMRLGRYEDAERSMEEAQAMRRQLLLPGNPQLVMGLVELAQLYYANGRYDRALPLYEENVALLRRTVAPTHPMLGMSLTGLGNLYRAMSRFAEARPLLEEALAQHRRTLHPDDANLCADLNNLALLYHETGESQQALPLFEEALRIARAGTVAPMLTSTLINTGLCHDALGRTDAAAALMEEAVANARATLPPDHPDLAWAIGQLAFMREQQGDWEAAERLQLDALARKRAVLPPGHPEIADTLKRLATIALERGRLPEAQAAFTEALAICRAAYPAGHVDTIYALNNFGGFHLRTGNPAAAVPLLDDALALSRRLLPPGHPLLLESLRVLGLACQQAGQAFRAQACFTELQRALDAQAA